MLNIDTDTLQNGTSAGDSAASAPITSKAGDATQARHSDFSVERLLSTAWKATLPGMAIEGGKKLYEHKTEASSFIGKAFDLAAQAIPPLGIAKTAFEHSETVKDVAKTAINPVGSIFKTLRKLSDPGL